MFSPCPQPFARRTASKVYRICPYREDPPSRRFSALFHLLLQQLLTHPTPFSYPSFQLLYSLQVLPEINLTKIASKVFGRPPYSFHDWFQQRWKEDCLESLSTGRAGMDKGEDVPCCSAFCHLSCNFTKSQLQGAFPTVVLWLHLLPALASKSSGFYGWSFGRMGMKKGKYFENRAFGHEMRRLSFKFKDSHFVKFSVGRRLCDGYFAISSWIGRGSFQVFKVSQGLQVSRQRVLIYDLLASRPGHAQRLRGMNSKRASMKPWCCV